MKKFGTPESEGKCDICGKEGIVVPVDKETMKVASRSKTSSSSVQMACADCSGVSVNG